MEGLELDFYIDELKLAAEVQGDQHYRFIEYFHKNNDGYLAQRKRDEKKEYLCRINGIKLVEIFTEKDADLLIMQMKEKKGGQKIEVYKGMFEFDKKKEEDLYTTIPELRQAVKIARRSIVRMENKENKKNHFQRTVKLIARVLVLCQKNNVDVFVPEIVEFCEENQIDVFSSRRIHICESCSKQNPKMPQKKFTEKSLQEHINTCHKKGEL